MDTTGVVGELRIPDPVRRAYRSTPALAMVFVCLTIVDAAPQLAEGLHAASRPPLER
jgi:hypothetical protein